MLLAIPLAVAAALYTSEFAHPWAREVIKPAIEILAGIPSVVFGPGNCTVAHGSNEYVSIDEIVAATKTLLLIVFRWCGVRDA